MKVIIAGSRQLVAPVHVITAIEKSQFNITEVVCGGARGVDEFGKKWADDHGIPVKPFYVSKSDWDLYGKVAGPMRNARMAQYADALIAVWDGESRGTKNMIQLAEQESNKREFYLFVYRVSYKFTKIHRNTHPVNAEDLFS